VNNLSKYLRIKARLFGKPSGMEKQTSKINAEELINQELSNPKVLTI
jgi:hypothetical protein